MSDWNPALYSKFEDERTRPATELLARVPVSAPAQVVDLGCGPGNSTELLVHRFAAAHIIGTDTSPAMLAAARQRLPAITFELSDISSWAPQVPVDLLYANASLHWVSDHASLFPRLLSVLAPGGVLAVQMPDNIDEPSHVLMRETAADARFAPSIDPSGGPREFLLAPDQYYDLLAQHAQVDVWRTTYYHRMEGATAIVQWLRTTGLKPFLDALRADLQSAFLAEYEQRIAAAYPPRSDGRCLLAFPRLFIVARRR